MNYLDPNLVTAPQQYWKLHGVIYDMGEWNTSTAFGSWEGDPCLACRWNGSLNGSQDKGSPISRAAHPIWFIIPEYMVKSILTELQALRAGGDTKVNEAVLERAIQALIEQPL